MQIPDLTLGLRATERAPGAIQNYVRELAKRDRAAGGEGIYAAGRTAALEALAESLPVEARHDPRLYGMQLVHQALNGGMLGEVPFSPSPRQYDLFARLASGAPAPTNDATLSELLAAGVEDLALEYVKLKAASREAQGAADEAKAAESAASDRMAMQEEALTFERERVAALEEELKEASANLAYLRSVAHGGAEPAAAKPKAKGNGDRKSLPGHTGVYTRERSEGTVYEIGWIDAEKKQRWKRLGVNLNDDQIREAEALRDSLSGQPFKEVVLT